MQTRTRDIYNKAINVIRSCETIHHIDVAYRYVDLAITQIMLNSNKSRSIDIDLMVKNLAYYLRARGIYVRKRQ